jgi:hypothetical protein
MKADREEILAEIEARIAAENKKFEVLQNTFLSRMDVHHERMMVCLGKTEAKDLEANSEETQSEAVNWEVPKEVASVKTGRPQNKRHRGRHLAEKRRQ